MEAQQEQFSDADIDSAEYEELSAQIESARAELESLEAQSESVGSQMSSLDSDAESLGINLENVGSGAKDSADGMGGAGDNASTLSDALNKASGMAGALGGTISGVLSGGIEGLMDIIPQVTEMIIQMVQQFDEANSTLVEMTGATGDALAEMNEVAKETSLALDGMNVSDTAGVVGELNTRLDLTGQELQKATYLVGQFADVTGSDATKSVKFINDIMKNWGIETKDMNSLLDKLVVAGQRSGISVDQLATSLKQNQYILSDMGYDLDESISLLANFEKNGIETQKVMAGLTTATSKWAKEGKSAKDGFAEMSEGIKNAKTNEDALALATEYLGSRNAKFLVPAIRDGRFEFDYMTEAIRDSNGALLDTEARADTFSEKADTLGTAIQTVAFSGETLGEWFEFAGQQADLMGTSVGDATLQYLGLAEAEQGYLDKSAEMQEAHATEINLLTQQGQLEQLASNGYDTMSTNMDSITAKIEELNGQYKDNYDTAYKNINSSIGLFEEMTTKSGKSVTSMIGSLKSQVSYMDTYQSNIKRAMELGVDQGLVQKLSDGSKESAEILQSIVDDGGEHVTELNEEFLKVEEGKKSFSDTYAQMATDFDTKMSQIEKRVELAEDSMDAYKEMYKDGANSVQGFINGANSKLESVKRTFKKLADTGKREIQKGYDMHSPSRVMMQYGVNVTEGFADGVLKELDVVENAFSKMAKVPEMTFDDMGDLTTNRTMKSVTINAPVQVLQRLDNAELSRVSGTITDIVGRQFARRTGGVL